MLKYFQALMKVIILDRFGRGDIDENFINGIILKEKSAYC